MGCTISGTGKSVPALTVTNDMLAEIVDTSDEWIVQRTGIHSRQIALQETSTSLATDACTKALGSLDAREVDLIICMTITPDTTIPCQASLIKEALHASGAIAFDLNAACSGCVYGMTVAHDMMMASQLNPHRSNPLKHALIVGVERLSRIVDWQDRSTCVLFGDGAGAVLLSWDDEKPGILSSFLKNTDDTDMTLNRANIYDMSTFPFGEVSDPILDKSTPRANPFITMKGQPVFKFATAALVEATEQALLRAQLSLEDVSLIVPHQANERIIRYASKKLGIGMERFQVSIQSSANSSAASALMALDDAYEAKRITSGDNVLLIGFGGGLTSGAVLYQAS